MYKIITTLIILILIIAGNASASSFKFVVEQGGNNWTLDNGNNFGMVGFSQIDSSDSFTLADVKNQIRSGQAISFYAGPGADVSEYTKLTDDFAFDYSSVGGNNNRVVGAFYVEYAPGNLVLNHYNRGGTATLGSKGSLGDFGPIPSTPTPIPGAVFILGGGLAALIGLRRKFGKS